MDSILVAVGLGIDGILDISSFIINAICPLEPLSSVPSLTSSEAASIINYLCICIARLNRTVTHDKVKLW